MCYFFILERSASNTEFMYQQIGSTLGAAPKQELSLEYLVFKPLKTPRFFPHKSMRAQGTGYSSGKEIENARTIRLPT